jgi:4-hydroxy-3-methylbut-2-en-1-yl diphosphate reductase
MIQMIVNGQRLDKMEIEEMPIDDGKKQFDVVKKGDVVLPAFGAGVDEMLTLSNKNVQIVDTTCPWISKVLFNHVACKVGFNTYVIISKITSDYLVLYVYTFFTYVSK